MAKCDAVRNVFELITACQMSIKYRRDPLLFTINKDGKYTWPNESLLYNIDNTQTIVMIVSKDIKDQNVKN